MPALKPATIGQKLLTDCGQNRPLTTADADNISEISEVKDKLIVIDRADIILDKTTVKTINNDSSNRYLIFARKPLGIEVTPNHFAEFQFDYDKRQVTINYLFDVKGWC